MPPEADRQAQGEPGARFRIPPCFRPFILLGGGDVLPERLAEIVHEAKLEEPPTVQLWILLLQHHGQETDPPGVCRSALGAPVRRVGEPAGVLEPFSTLQKAKNSVPCLCPSQLIGFVNESLTVLCSRYCGSREGPVPATA